MATTKTTPKAGAKAATKTTTNKAAPKPAAKPTPKAGENAATAAINQASAEGATGVSAKADAVKNAAELQAQREAGQLKERRFVVANGRAVRKGGVRYSAGEHIDLDDGDSERFLADGTVLELDDADDQDDGDDAAGGEGQTLTANGVTVPHPDTEEGKALQQQQEAAAAAKEAEQTGKGLPSGAENH